MKEEFDLDKIGKQMPYQVPSGFFEEITSQTLAEAKRRSSSSKGLSLSSWKVLCVAASVAVLLMAGFLFFTYRQDAAPEIAQLKPVESPAQESKVSQEPVAPYIMAEQPKVTALPKPDRNATPAKPALSNPIAKVAKQTKTETLEDLLACITDEELEQLAAIAESEEHMYEETIEE